MKYKHSHISLPGFKIKKGVNAAGLQNLNPKFNLIREEKSLGFQGFSYELLAVSSNGNDIN